MPMHNNTSNRWEQQLGMTLLGLAVCVLFAVNSKKKEENRKLRLDKKGNDQFVEFLLQQCERKEKRIQELLEVVKVLEENETNTLPTTNNVVGGGDKDDTAAEL